jgi:hypothetical protein
MRKPFNLYILSTIIILSCNSTDYKQNFKNSKVVSYNLIKLCVDKAFETDTSINTKNYVLDLSSIRTLNQNGIDSFLTNKHSLMPTSQEDSAMTFENKDWSRFHMNKSMVIKIKSIDSINENGIKINLSKYKSTDEIIEAEFELERYKNTYKIVNFKQKN